jgi:acetaldehyde dehydrogenase
MTTTKVAIICSGNIGTDLMFKVRRLSTILQVACRVGDRGAPCPLLMFCD